MIPDRYRALIETDRVSAGTRALLLARGVDDDPGYRPAVLTEAGLVTLRSLVDRVLPQPGPDKIDLAARIDAMLAAGPGDGWRHAALPRDAEAWRAGLQTLDDVCRAVSGESFAASAVARQEQLLAQVEAGQGGGPALDGDQMRLWFQEMRAEAARLYVAHPATLARLGYGGIASARGFARIGPDERDAWEKLAGDGA